jgi:hypothetical protein
MRLTEGSLLENPHAVQKMPPPVSSSAGFHKTILALDSLNWIRDIVMTAHANKIGLAIIFEPNHG